jgi:hypothetical protein
MDFDCEVWAKQFTLHAFDAVFRSWDCDQENIHLQDILRAEFDADAAAFAVAFDDFDSCTTHSGWSPLYLDFSLKQRILRRKDSTSGQATPQLILYTVYFSRLFTEAKKTPTIQE